MQLMYTMFVAPAMMKLGCNLDGLDGPRVLLLIAFIDVLRCRIKVPHAWLSPQYNQGPRVARLHSATDLMKCQTLAMKEICPMTRFAIICLSGLRHTNTHEHLYTTSGFSVLPW